MAGLQALWLRGLTVDAEVCCYTGPEPLTEP